MIMDYVGLTSDWLTTFTLVTVICCYQYTLKSNIIFIGLLDLGFIDDVVSVFPYIHLFKFNKVSCHKPGYAPVQHIKFVTFTKNTEIVMQIALKMI